MVEGKKAGSRVRSPAYPSITLERAIEYAVILFGKEHRGQIAPDVAARHMGFKGRTGGGARALAALRQYGLLQVVDGSAALTERALDLVLAPDEASPHRRDALRAAALSPKLHRELWELADDGPLPSDDQLEYYLVRERNFNPNRVERFLKSFRQTIESAGLAGPKRDDPAEQSGGETAPNDGPAPAAATAPSPAATGPHISFPLPRRNRIVIQLDKPVTDGEFETIKSLLEVAKDSLTDEVSGEEADG